MTIDDTPYRAFVLHGGRVYGIVTDKGANGIWAYSLGLRTLRGSERFYEMGRASFYAEYSPLLTGEAKRTTDYAQAVAYLQSVYDLPHHYEIPESIMKPGLNT